MIPAPPASDHSPVWGWVRVRALVLNSLPSPHSERVYGKALDDFWDWSGCFFHQSTPHRHPQAGPGGRGARPTSRRRRLCHHRDQRHPPKGHPPRYLAHARPGTRIIASARRRQLARAARPGPPRHSGALRAPARRSGDPHRRNDPAARGRWVLVDIEGKGHHCRSVPRPAFAKAAADQWREAVGITEGRLLRAISQGGEVGSGLTAQAVYLIVREYAFRLGVKLAPHDLRRTFAKLAHRGNSPLEQIQISLGHDSILTTERYLGVRQSLTDAPCDHLGIDLGKT